MRRQRLRWATAVARLASFWPMMKRSSSETISRGVRSVMSWVSMDWEETMRRGRSGSCRADLFHREVAVGVDADVGGDGHGLAGDLLGGEVAVRQPARGGEGVHAARADGGHVVLGLQHVARAGDDVKLVAVGDDEHRLELLQVLVGEPLLGEIEAGALKLSRRGLEPGFELFQQGEGIRRRPGE